jgi:hypothetical protein
MTMKGPSCFRVNLGFEISCLRLQMSETSEPGLQGCHIQTGFNPPVMLLLPDCDII